MLLRRRLDLHFSLKKGLALLLVSLIIIGASGYIAMSPPTFTTTEQTNQTAYTTDLGHQATTVETNSSLYQSGTVLSNKTVYYQNLHSTLEVTPQTSHTPVSEDVSIRMFATQNRESNVIWEQNVPLTHQTTTYNQSTGTIALNISSIGETFEDRYQELPKGTIVWYEVKYTAEYEYAGSQFTQTSTTTINLNTPTTYEVKTSDSEATKSETNTVTEPIPAQSISIFNETLGLYGLIGMSFGGLILLVSLYLLYGYKFDKRSHNERLYRYHLEKYRDWITFGRPLTDPQLRSDAENKVLVNTLKGLVQISVDSDARIVYSEELKRFYIFINQNIYLFNPPTSVSPLDLYTDIPSVPNIDSNADEETQQFDETVWKEFDE